MLAEWKETRFRVEVALLLALCFFLPLLEAPKNLAWLGYAAAWLANRVRARDFGGRWDGWDTLFALWIASGFVVAAAAQFGEFRGGEWGGAMDLLRYASIGWLVKRGGYDARVQRWALGALVVSTLLGLAIGYARMWSGIGKSGTLQLYSVGHVNHSAIYIAIVLGIWAAWFFAAVREWSGVARLVGATVFAILFIGLASTASRAAVGAGIAALVLLAVAWWSRSRVPLAIVAAAIGLVIAGAAVLRTDLVQKQAQYEAQGNPLSHRDTNWRTGTAAWKRQPWFGIGMDNYSQLTAERLKAWHAQAGEPFDPARFVYFPHAHSLYMNTLAERGIFGFAVLFLVLGAWGWGLVRARPGPGTTRDGWTLWGASASGLVVTLAAGLLNTTLHHEHGILAALLLGLWAGTPRRAARAP
jgi:O-antigen ligase